MNKTVIFLIIFLSIAYIHEYIHYLFLKKYGANPELKIKKIFKVLPAPALYVEDGSVSKKQSIVALLAPIIPVGVLYTMILNAYIFGVIYAIINGFLCSLFVSGFDIYNMSHIMIKGRGI